MPLTLLVEPNPVGHRFQSVLMVTEVAARTGPVMLLTSIGATDHPAYAEFLSDVDLHVVETLDGLVPPTRQIVAEIARLSRAHEIGKVLVLDADQCLKRWWFEAPRAFRHIRSRPAVLFMLTRYPARVALADRVGWSVRVAKAGLVLLAKATGTLQRVSSYAGRADLSRGWLVKRVRDPAICSAHSRDRPEIRTEMALDPQRRLVGIFGVISGRKYPQLVFDAIRRSDTDADLLLAGEIRPDVQEWLDSLSDAHRARVIVRPGFLPDHEIDRAVAAVDVVALAMTNNGPSGIMGKALAAGVPVVSAGSRVRAEELLGTNAGEAAELEPDDFARALRRVLSGTRTTKANPAPPTTPTQYAECLLGLASNGPPDQGDATTGPDGSVPHVHPRVRAIVRRCVLVVNTPIAKARMRRAAATWERPIKLEIGGTSTRAGWLVTNVNATSHHYLDANTSWPFEDGALSHVYADNMIEHISLDAARRMLAEAHRCLRPGGVIRLVTPDIRGHVELYLAGRTELDGVAADKYRRRGLTVEHPVDLVRIPIGSFGHHLGYVYDFESLDAELTRAGFHGTTRCDLGTSAHHELAGLDQRNDDGEPQIAVEATR